MDDEASIEDKKVLYDLFIEWLTGPTWGNNEESERLVEVEDGYRYRYSHPTGLTVEFIALDYERHLLIKRITKRPSSGT